MVDEDKAILGDEETVGIGEDVREDVREDVGEDIGEDVGEDVGDAGVQTSGKSADHLEGLMRTEVTGIEFSIASIILVESFGPTAS